MTRLYRTVRAVITGREPLPWPLEVARIVLIAAVVGTALMLAVRP